MVETIEGIFAQIYRPFETVVVNGGSTDHTAEALESFGERNKMIRQDNAGQAVTKNRGPEATICDFIAFQDADDLWLPDKLKIQMERLGTHPEADLSTCLMEQFCKPEFAEEGECPKNTTHAQPYPAMWQGILVLRPVFEPVGALDTGVRFGDVRKWLHRARGMGIVVEHIDRVLVQHRIHLNNLSRCRGEHDLALLLCMAERALVRRRAVGPKE